MITDKLQLPQVTLATLTGVNYKQQEHLEALWKSQEGIRFGEVKLIELEKIKDISTWNEAVIYDLPKYINTDFVLFIHSDGYVINPEAWRMDWFKYDYAGSPWPLPNDNYSYRDSRGQIVRVGNSVGLRSKKLMDLAATRLVEYRYGNNSEDGHIACWNRNWLEEQGCKFMPFEEAIYFGKETELPENKDLKTFLFHKL